jgi:membrane protein
MRCSREQIARARASSPQSLAWARSCSPVGVVVQLKDALNTVWEVKTPPGSGIWRFVRTYIWSLAGVLSLGFLLLISMLLTAALSAAGKYIAPYLPEATLQIAGSLASFAVIALLFALMFKWLPDTPIASDGRLWKSSDRGNSD